MRTFITKAMLRVMVLLAVMPPVSAQAGHYSVGHVYDGYVLQSDGYWHKGGARFTLKEWQEYDRYGCLQTYYRYEPAVVVNITPPENWQALAIKELGRREEYRAFRETFDALNGGSVYSRETINLYNGQFRYDPYSVKQFDRNLAIQGLGLTQDTMLKVLAAMDVERNASVRQAVSEESTAALFQIMASELIRIKQAGQPAATIQTEQRIPAPEKMPMVEIMGGVNQKALAVDKQKCATCHQKEGVKWSAAVHFAAPPEQQRKWVGRMVTETPGKPRMPKGGAELAAEEVFLFMPK